MESNTQDMKQNETKHIEKLVLYIGQDLSYLESLQDKYKEVSPSIGANFMQMYEETPEGIQFLILKIKELRPKVVIIDYSRNAFALLHLTRVWLRQNSGRDTNLIGLCDYVQGSSIILKSIMTTIKCVHIKSSEFEAICFDINILGFTEKAANHGFAAAKLSEEFTICYPAKVGYVQQGRIRVESDVDLSKSSKFRFHSFWSRNEIINSAMVKLEEQASENLFYNHKYAQVLEMLYSEIDLDSIKDIEDKYDASHLLNKYETEVEESREALALWINEHLEYSNPKFLKALIVDKENSLFQNRPISDQYDYIFRTQSYIINPEIEVEKLKPHIIIYNLEYPTEEELAANNEILHTYNTTAVLAKVTDVINSRSGSHEPFIIAFNSQELTTEMLQKKLQYKKIIGVSDAIDVDLVLKMCQLLKAKIEPTLQDFSQNTIYIDKNSDVSYGEIEAEIILREISENDIYFDSEIEIPEKTVFRMFLTNSFYVTVLPTPNFAKSDAKYYGIIHGIGEEERQPLRQFINSIFFKDLNLKKEEESAKVEEQKQKFLDDKKIAEEKQKEVKEKAIQKEKELEEKANTLLSKSTKED